MSDESRRPGVPVRNRNRAIAFYSALLGMDLGIEDETFAPVRFEECDDTSALIQLRIASLDAALEIVWSNGGRVLEPERLEETPVRQVLCMDCEGNRLALLTEPTSAIAG